MEEKDQFILELKEEHLERIEGLNEKITLRDVKIEALESDIQKLTEEVLIATSHETWSEAICNVYISSLLCAAQMKEAKHLATQARHKYDSDTQSLVENSIAIQQGRELMLMQFEDQRSAWHKEFLTMYVYVALRF